MDILSIIGSLNNAAEMKRIGQKVYDQFQPVNEAMDSARTGIASTLGITKEIVDPGDGSIQTVTDEDEYARRQKALVEQLQNMTAPRNLNMELMQAPQPQMQQMQQPMVNPYAPVNYGTMQPQMTGGIGSVPTLDQVLAALQARQ